MNNVFHGRNLTVMNVSEIAPVGDVASGAAAELGTEGMDQCTIAHSNFSM